MITSFGSWSLSKVRRYCSLAVLLGFLASPVPYRNFKKENKFAGQCDSQDFTTIGSHAAMQWTKSSTELESMSSFVNYSAQRAHSTVPASASYRQSQTEKLSSYSDLQTCPYYPYADGGRVAKWYCGFEKATDILSVLPVVRGCPIRLGSEQLITEYVDSLNGKTLWILGESLSVEIFIALACQLRALSDSQFHTVSASDLAGVRSKVLKSHWKKLHTKNDMRGIHCVHIIRGTLRSRICLCRIHKDPFEFGHFRTLTKFEGGLKHFTDFISLTRPSDVLLFGFGIDENSQAAASGELSYAKQLSLFLKHYDRNRSYYPRLIWRETPAQHFRSKSGVYHASRVGEGCIDLSLTNNTTYSESNWRNLVANPIVDQYKFPILKLWMLSAERSDAHVGKDCTHYCLPGLPDLWAVYLMQMIYCINSDKSNHVIKSCSV
jgi:hypothetical protein